MSRTYNFCPGPAALPDAVIYQAQAELPELGDCRASVMEISHRSAAFLNIYQQTDARLREVMNISDDYAVLFLAGGATGQAAAVPLNLTAHNQHAAYIISGHWSRRAAEEARRYCQVTIAGDSAAQQYTTLPTELTIPADAAYLHIAENETVHGVEYANLPTTTLPLVADLSSNIATRVINVNDYGLIYAGAQKNLGIAGVTLVIVRRELIHPQAQTPSVWDYQKQEKSTSMYNTPPTFQIYLMGLMLDWIKQQGGVAAMEKINSQKSRLLYDYLDSTDFYLTPVNSRHCRSRINIPFLLAEESLTADFLAGCAESGLLGLAGHKVVGGVRASLYNSMPLAGVAALVEYMRLFEQQRG